MESAIVVCSIHPFRCSMGSVGGSVRTSTAQIGGTLSAIKGIFGGNNMGAS